MEENEKKTFKDVHEDLEKENTFLQKNHDINNFKNKADFLNRSGFKNSIATKLYSAISENHNVIHGYQSRYDNKYKFILEPQLERICEKYNLYVRNVDLFISDIPEKNIADMIDFKLHVEDLPIEIKDIRGFNLDYFIEENQKSRLSNVIECSITRTLTLSVLGEIDNALRDNNKETMLKIAAVKGMFSDEAFKTSEARILKFNGNEAKSKNQVDLDPIVLYKTKHGYIVITAWGDEANDELLNTTKEINNI